MSDTPNEDLSFEELPTEEVKLGIAEHVMVLAVISVITFFGNAVATNATVPQGLIGLALLYVLCMVGVVITRFAPIKLPSVAWISLVAIIVTTPWFPGNDWILAQVKHINFLTLATPCLTDAGIAIAQREIDIAKSSGWKMFVIAVLVMAGTYVGSAVVAQIFL
ncbi:hypothetical protein [Breoghania sp.]|uniref:hypothetical protein n=1 Tax=Breoghania sp. TaxID=2065378 RepID=UPI00262F06A7|nr:hypothetical protein [Breoghania sp.]MDJ0931517.1 hypothetical protein [Breoghania sp.]